MKTGRGDFNLDFDGSRTPFKVLAGVALFVLLLDQVSKLLIGHFIEVGGEYALVSGFFSLVHWWNTGAAWSMFAGKNLILASVGVLAIFLFYFFRRHFSFARLAGQISMGLVMGGILGNLIDRVSRGHVVDFLYFTLITQSGKEISYPAFNVADMGICCGVGLIVFLSFQASQE